MGNEVCDLSQKHCTPCEEGGAPLGLEEAQRLLSKLSGWELGEKGISKKYDFKNYYQTIAFVNAIAWIAHAEGHHPDLEVSYRSCLVRYTTHAVRGLSENDFICAARVDALFGKEA
ncbi:4a-hydroxytetrahydrobiopterin dehydratase [Geomonas sp. RF6]|uniref:4a-hydroxytetrahydrobiopterin dehydratase n=1 Tax=Geomonas sp. RF6 TaxID=2897342 RepID=UPI001E348E70|nr:4a-hydroxytetrahydrobiopterin dehydratase [Geomonas sp. RF6]UFS70153.1 4a-hydroxytetrahydrobiopterin dehydratase [Geomonas sp. RF6]